ncbi:MAG: type IV secretory system conjugative DNA transfer family protein [Candidatus Sumerlaeia bacterium]|nr:type IV secretory system conjugative DNA transfer family protein [Candidatus Sumerlaeia bacterium]
MATQHPLQPIDGLHPIHLGYRLPPPPRRRGETTTGPSALTAPEESTSTFDPDAGRRADARIPPDASAAAGARPARFRRGAVEPLTYDDTLHLLTIAPTGAGKGRRLIIPALLNQNRQVVAIDPKGENLAVTARQRARLGQRPHAVAPFAKGSLHGAVACGINPFDILKLPDVDLEDEAARLAHTLCQNTGGARNSRGNASDPFWDANGMGLVAGAVLLIVSVMPPEKHHLGTLYDLLHGDDVVYNLAVLMDTAGAKAKPKTKPGKDGPPPPADKAAPPAAGDGDEGRGRMNHSAYQEVAAFLQMPEMTRGGVLATAQSYLKIFRSPKVQASVRSTGFPIQAFIDGAPMTIYLVLPTSKLGSHGTLLKLWTSTLMRLVLERERIPEGPTLFLLDEAAQLGHLDDLERAVTVGRGYGMQVWSFWQDLSQLETLYPSSWTGLVNNCGVVNCFGAQNHLMRGECARLMGVPVELAADLAADEQLAMMDGEVVRAFLPDYLSDPAYEGLADPNPFHAPPPPPSAQEPPKPAKPAKAEKKHQREPKRRRRADAQGQLQFPEPLPPRGVGAEPPKDQKPAEEKKQNQQPKPTEG